MRQAKNPCSSLYSRVGTFEIPADLLYSNPDLFMAIMAEVLIVRCEMMHVENAFLYTAYSPWFKELQPGMISPRYVVEADDETLDVRFHQIDHLGQLIMGDD
jgi:hypothetical protein